MCVCMFGWCVCVCVLLGAVLGGRESVCGVGSVCDCGVCVTCWGVCVTVVCVCVSACVACVCVPMVCVCV